MSAWITQAEADALLDLEKHRVDEERRRLPDLGGGLVVRLASADGTEGFHLDITRSRINLKKGTLQNRGRTTIVLARLDFGGTPHRNPDGEEIASPHLHVYREGFGDKWAFDLPDVFSQTEDRFLLLQEFMKYCKIGKPPIFEAGLFT